MSDFTLKQLADNRYTLNQVKTFANQGRISEKIYWEYYHLWLYSTFRYGSHPVCVCLDCHNGVDKEVTTQKLLDQIKG